MRTGRRIRAPLAAVVVLTGAATALGMDAGAPPEPRAANGVSPVLPAQGITLRISTPQGRAPVRVAEAYYRRTARKRVPRSTPSGFLPLYREAARRYGLNWRLLASIHRQETAFSTAESTYHGLNDFGCCAGPMQFNVTNGPVSTWKRYRDAFRVGNRPKRYPHRTRHHPSIYDDFDAMMAAGWLLSDAGAGRELDAAAWRAAYAYYGHDLFGVTYANQVLARAVAWQRDGFCPNCAVDESLVEEFEIAYGEAARAELLDAERKEKKKKKKKKKKKRKRDKQREDRADRGGSDSRDRSSRRSPQRSRPRAPRSDENTRAEPAPPPPAQTTPAEPPATTTPAPPPPPRCSPIEKLLGCK